MPKQYKPRTPLQISAQKRNFTIMQLRGIYANACGIRFRFPHLGDHCERICEHVEQCLGRLGAKTEAQRKEEFKLEIMNMEIKDAQ